MSTPTASADTLAHVRSVWNRTLDNSPIYKFILSEAKIIHASPGRILLSLPISAPHINSKGILHGVVSAALTDALGTLVIAATGATYTGVSTDLHVSYLSAAKEGDELLVEGKARKIGKTLAFIGVEVRVGDKSVAEGSHTKFVGGR